MEIQLHVDVKSGQTEDRLGWGASTKSMKMNAYTSGFFKFYQGLG